MDTTAPAAALTTRLLPFVEWKKLAHTPLRELATVPAEPEGTLVVVVEQADEILACWSAIQTVHLEGLWEAPEVRGNPGIGRALLRQMMTTLRGGGIPGVLTLALTPEVETLIQKFGGTLIPGTTWILPVPPVGEKV